MNGGRRWRTVGNNARVRSRETGGDMSLMIVLLFATALACDVAGQLFFKIGATRLPDPHGPDRLGFVRALLTDVWLLAGIVAYLTQLVVWLRILSQVPISVAFPVASVNFLGVVFASRIFLKERIETHQWAGAGLVTCGVAMVAGLA